jgi:hypothetical protein
VGMRKHIIWQFSKELIQENLDTSSSYDEFFKKINLNVSKSLIKMLRYRTKIENISHEKFNNNVKKRRQENISQGNKFKPIPIENILVKNSTYTSSVNLKKKLLNLGLLKNECAICQINSWLDKPLVLQLDHINGKNNDNRITNLRLLCPNCHSQTENYAGKKKKNNKKRKLNYCIKCGISVNNKVFCENCQNEISLKQRKVKRPDYEKLMCDINNLGYSATGRKYGVSDVTIKKWQKKYEQNRN